MIPEIATFELVNDCASCRVADPRTTPHILGARYVHGGYVLELTTGDSILTGSAVDGWTPYIGTGLPEVFESGLGFNACSEGDSYLRIGAGRVIRQPGSAWNDADLPLEEAVKWEVDEVGPSRLVMSCRDVLTIAGKGYGYELTRRISLGPDSLTSESCLMLTVPWSEPVIWFAHPFFQQARGDATGLKGPAALQPGNAEMSRDGNGYFRFRKDGGFCPMFGAWGSREDLELSRDNAKRIRIACSHPLEKIVCYATPSAFSCEPYLSRAWLNSEKASWSIRYSWR